MSNYVLEHTPILSGTLTGTIFTTKDDAIQTFQQNFETGEFVFTSIGTPVIYATSGSLDLKTGALTFIWSDIPGFNHIIVSYEYEHDSA